MRTFCILPKADAKAADEFNSFPKNTEKPLNFLSATVSFAAVFFASKKMAVD